MLRHWRSLGCVHFIETQVFTRQITSLLDDADYRQLQVTLALKPRAGDVIRGSGGLRKIRCALRGRGKSGGIRVIYYLVADEEIYFSSLTRRTKRKISTMDNCECSVIR
jgi:mRNA-degrading endonuclease RelE of RelBE toxin-antitoxin system